MKIGRVKGPGCSAGKIGLIATKRDCSLAAVAGSKVKLALPLSAIATVCGLALVIVVPIGWPALKTFLRRSFLSRRVATLEESFRVETATLSAKPSLADGELGGGGHLQLAAAEFGREGGVLLGRFQLQRGERDLLGVRL